MEVRSLLTGYRGVSLPFTDFCEPLLKQDADHRYLIDYVLQYANSSDWKFVEFRGDNNMFTGEPHSTYFYNHTLDLRKGENEIFSNFRGSTIRNIKRAIKEGVKIRIDQSFESIKEFYRLNCITRREHGLPPQPRSFFHKLHDHVISKDMGFVVLGSYNGSYIAGAVYLHFGNQAIYKYGASDKQYQHLRANNLVMWEAIKWYAVNKYRMFSFGKTEAENEGLRQFKMGWGPMEEIVKYFRYDVRKKAFVCEHRSVSRLQERFFRMMPIAVSQSIGSLLYKHVG